MSAPWRPDCGRERRSSSTWTTAGPGRPGGAVGSLGGAGPPEQENSVKPIRIARPKRVIKFECNSPSVVIPPSLLSPILHSADGTVQPPPPSPPRAAGRLAPDVGDAERLGAGVGAEDGANLADLDLGSLQLRRQLLADSAGVVGGGPVHHCQVLDRQL